MANIDAGDLGLNSMDFSSEGVALLDESFDGRWALLGEKVLLQKHGKIII